MRAANVCTVDGCPDALYCKGFCRKHYKRVQRLGSVNLPERPAFCVADSCDSPAKAKGLCGLHYTRMSKYGSFDLPPKPVKLCTVEGCDKVVRCSGLCSPHYKMWQAKGYTNLETRECEMCAAVFNPVGNARVCAECRPAFEKKYNEEWRARNRAHIRSYSAEHYARPSTKAKRAKWMKEHPEDVRQWAQRRRARIRGGGAFTVTTRDLRRTLHRCGSSCVYCGVGLTTETLTWDHAVPLFRGGRHSIGNLLPACKPCNSSKRDKTYLEYVVWRKGVQPQQKAA